MPDSLRQELSELHPIRASHRWWYVPFPMSRARDGQRQHGFATETLNLLRMKGLCTSRAFVPGLVEAGPFYAGAEIT